MRDPVLVKVKGVCIAEADGGIHAPMVILEDESGRIVPLFVGLSEAISIYLACTGKISPRPTTHDLFVSTLERLNAKITNVLIDDLRDGVYYAMLTVSIDSVEQNIDARPSDCMALAIRSNAPIYMQESVIVDSCVDKSKLGLLKDIESYI
ncbi:MAG: bifunctional nuclease family protein [Methanotrichaceae archaeon]